MFQKTPCITEWGSGGRRFESSRSDQYFQGVKRKRLAPFLLKIYFSPHPAPAFLFMGAKNTLPNSACNFYRQKKMSSPVQYHYDMQFMRWISSFRVRSSTPLIFHSSTRFRSPQQNAFLRCSVITGSLQQYGNPEEAARLFMPSPN